MLIEEENVPISQCANVLMEEENVPMCQCANVLMEEENVPMCQCANVLMEEGLGGGVGIAVNLMIYLAF